MDPKSTSSLKESERQVWDDVAGSDPSSRYRDSNTSNKKAKNAVSRRRSFGPYNAPTTPPCAVLPAELSPAPQNAPSTVEPKPTLKEPQEMGLGRRPSPGRTRRPRRPAQSFPQSSPPPRRTRPPGSSQNPRSRSRRKWE
ncbi:hypothetical protein C8R47DRAFT_1230754 [Mycena vitilis]|nr:hypothetical protein C8R47DRAFT_1230754 [Mycena vitilis]